MVVHFTTSIGALERDPQSIRKMVQIIHKLDHLLAIDWVEATYYRYLRKGADEVEWEESCEMILDAIERSEVAIIEASDKGFGVGFETAMSISKNKPTLLLLKKGEYSPSRFSAAYKHPLITRKEYDGDTIEKIIAQFLKQNTVRIKDLRFNFVADRQIYNHLHWKSTKTGKPKSEILRQLIQKDIKRKTN